MWQLLSLDSSVISNRVQPANHFAPSSTSRRITCLIFLFAFTLVLTIASMYEHFANICIGFLFIIVMFFLVYSILITSNNSSESNMRPDVNSSIWTIEPMHHQINGADQILRSPPSYESVIKDSAYIYNVFPPPYSEVVKNQAKDDKMTDAVENLPQTDGCSQRDKPVVIDVRTLCQERS